MRVKIKELSVKKDKRGWLAEIIRSEDVGNSKFGQILATTAIKGEIKGKHYHKRKTEWFCVLYGNGMLTIVNNETKEENKIFIGEDNMVLVKIPPFHFHEIKNIGNKEMLLLVYIDEAYISSDPDTYYDKPTV